jgi:hypothetical protein
MSTLMIGQHFWGEPGGKAHLHRKNKTRLLWAFLKSEDRISFTSTLGRTKTRV